MLDLQILQECSAYNEKRFGLVSNKFNFSWFVWIKVILVSQCSEIMWFVKNRSVSVYFGDNEEENALPCLLLFVSLGNYSLQSHIAPGNQKQLAQVSPP